MIEKLKQQVIDHAKDEAPSECCGLAVIVKGKLKYNRCTNINPGGQFAISPEDYALCSDQGEIVGVCHSHVGEPPEPSQADRVGIENTGLPWLIVNAATGEHTVSRPSGFKLPLIGRQFKHGTVDCMTLIHDYYLDLGIKLPNPYREDDWWLKGGDMYRDNFESAGFIKVGGSEFTAFKKHDVIIMQVGAPVPNHGAVYVGGNQIIQHCHGRLSSRDVYGGYWRKVTNMVLRHKELM